MSKSINDELIAEARTASVAVFLATDEPVARDLSRILRGLADALELATEKKSRRDVCYKCGETLGAVTDQGLICWDGYNPLGKHQWKKGTDENSE
jgi:hypothetical protein